MLVGRWEGTYKNALISKDAKVYHWVTEDTLPLLTDRSEAVQVHRWQVTEYSPEYFVWELGDVSGRLAVGASASQQSKVGVREWVNVQLSSNDPSPHLILLEGSRGTFEAPCGGVPSNAIILRRTSQ